MARAAQPVRRRLTAMMLLTSAAAIVLTCAAFVAYELVTARRNAQTQVATLARIVAANSTAALAFRDERDANEVLSALQTEPGIIAAALYDESGSIFAVYAARGATVSWPSTPLADGYRLGAAGLEGFEPVSEKPDHRLGTLYIRSNMSSLYLRFWRYGAIAGAVMLASLLLAYLLSRLFQRQISRPILSLADTARAISERGDFSVRAPVIGEGEFRLLTNAFNQMLGRIQEHSSERREGQTRLQAQLARLDLLQRTTRAIGERQDLDSIFNVILRRLEDNLPIDFGLICVYYAAAPALRVASIGPKSAARAAKLDITIGKALRLDQESLARCVQGVLVYEPDTSALDQEFPRQLAAVGLLALVGAPLLVEDQVFGVLLAARSERESFSSADCEFLSQLSEHVALAAHQVDLYTQLQKAYDDLRESQQSTVQQERLRALGQMASGIAHDINNAISPVTLYTDSLLEKEPGLSELGRESLRIIQRSIDDVGQTVTRMREFYRQQDQQVELGAVDLNVLVGQVLALTRARWSDVPQERGIVIDVRTDLAADLPKVLGMQGDIRDALTNLIFNAVDAMPEGGVLTLRTRRLAEPDRASEPPLAVELAVIDTGMGMDEEARRRCFEPFFTTKGERGTGMGLAMVYGMVKRQGARIEVDSAPGQGTSMRVHFAAAPSTAALPMPSPAGAAPQSLHLLVIDDDPLVGQSLHYVLQGEGHSVTVADSGQGGIDAFTSAHGSAQPFDLVMTDLGMPYVDGRAVAAAVKALSPTTPVVLLTGWGQRLRTEQSIPTNVDRLLSKPPKLSDLRRTLAELMAAKSTEHS